MRKDVLASKMKELRKGKNWSLGFMAKKIHVDYRTLEKYEEGVSFPSAKTVLDYTEKFHVSLEYLYFGTEISDVELCRKIGRLSPKQRKAIMTVIDSY